MLTRSIARRWLTLALPLTAMLLLTGCGPRVISAPPQPSVKPTLPDFARKCPPIPSWLSQQLTCRDIPTAQPTP